jgi:hypothetical protein
MARTFGKLLLRIVAGVLTLLLAIYLSLLGLEAYSARQAAKVLSGLEALRLGDPVADFDKIVSGMPTRYGDHVMTAGGWAAAEKLPGQSVRNLKVREVLCRAGLRWWELSVSSDAQNGKLTAISVRLLVEGRYETLGARWTLRPDIPWPESEMGLTGEDLRTAIGWVHITSARSGEGLRINATPQSTAQELHARTINRRCLFSFRGCDGFCQLLPDVVPVLKERKRNWGTSTGVPRSPCDPVPEKQTDMKSSDCRE